MWGGVVRRMDGRIKTKDGKADMYFNMSPFMSLVKDCESQVENEQGIASGGYKVLAGAKQTKRFQLFGQKRAFRLGYMAQ